MPATTLPLPAPTAPVRRAALWASGWTAFFILAHGYWALGGDLGYGDEESGFPPLTASAGDVAFTAIVLAMFAAGLLVPLALAQGRGPRRLVAGLMWVGCVVLAARGVSGLVDDAVRPLGISDTGITGLTYADTLGTSDPSAYTLWSTAGIDAFFALGGAVFGWAARRARRLS